MNQKVKIAMISANQFGRLYRWGTKTHMKQLQNERLSNYI